MNPTNAIQASLPLALIALLVTSPFAKSQTLAYQLDGEAVLERFSSAVVALGDQNGDGRADYGVFIPGRLIDQGPNQGRRGIIEIRAGRSGNLIRTLAGR